MNNERPETPGEGDPLEGELRGSPNEPVADGPIDLKEWAGEIPQEMAQIPSVRIRRKWVSVLWLLPITVIGLLVGIAIAQQLMTYSWMQEFLVQYPGTSDDYAPVVEGGFPAWLRWQHFLNLIFMMFIIRAGWQILADHPRLYLNSGSKPGTEWMRMRGPVPEDRMNPVDAKDAWTAKNDSVALPESIGIPGIRHSIGLARWWHFSFDIFWLCNGIVFFVLLFTTGQWERVVPQSWDVIPNAASTAVQYLALDLPANEGFTHYNGLQMIAYFLTLFVAAPLAVITGLLQSPAIAGKFGFGTGFLNRQVARTIHFSIMVWMVFFILMHTVMVWVTGLLGNINHITLGTNTLSWWGMAIYGFWMLVVVILWAWASPFTLKHPRLVQRIGTFVVGWIKGLMEWWDPRVTYKEKDISPFFWPNGTLPVSAEYQQLKATNYADYTLRIDGLVANPTTLSLAELKAMAKQEQITQHYCIQGWSGVAKWGGTSMGDVLDIVKPLPEAKWVVFYSFGDGSDGGRYYDCHKIENMTHALTILAYEMNGEPLNESHGAPLRLRNESELGFKQVKWIEAIEFVENFDHLGRGHGGYNEDQEFFGYRMPI